MPQKYHPNLKGKGWIRVTDDEAGEEEVDKVWELQKQAYQALPPLANALGRGSGRP